MSGCALRYAAAFFHGRRLTRQETMVPKGRSPILQAHRSNYLPAEYMRYWLLKSEPDELSIDDVANGGVRAFPWTGVRNFQARNFIREMQIGDLALFYHSSCADIGIAGIVGITSAAYPDPTQFDEKSPYYDPRATAANPRWLSVDVRYISKSPLISLATLRTFPELGNMRILSKGNRLSVTPVESAEWEFIQQLMS